MILKILILKNYGFKKKTQICKIKAKNHFSFTPIIFKWRRLWIYPKAWSTSIYAKNNDILSYINYVGDSMLDNKHINAFIRQYMELMERLFPGYRLFMKNYLV